MNMYKVIMINGTNDIVHADNERIAIKRYIVDDDYGKQKHSKLKEVKLLKSFTNQEWATHLEEQRKGFNISIEDGEIWKMVDGVMYVNGEKSKDKTIVTTIISKGEKRTKVEWV